MRRLEVCTCCKEVFRGHKGGKLLFSSGQTEWRVDFRWPKDICECCAMILGLEDYCELVLSRAGEREAD